MIIAFPINDKVNQSGNRKLFHMGAGDLWDGDVEHAPELRNQDAVILDIDSPGGTVAGTPELGAAVAALNGQKPVYAFSSGLMCSAAYWIASQAEAIYATPSARVGSIGVVQTVIDNSARLHAEGIKVFGSDALTRDEKLFLGGDYSVRGFDQDAVGPVGADGRPAGGQLLLARELNRRTSILDLAVCGAT